MAGKFTIEPRGHDRDLVNQLNKVFDGIEKAIAATGKPVAPQAPPAPISEKVNVISGVGGPSAPSTDGTVLTDGITLDGDGVGTPLFMIHFQGWAAGPPVSGTFAALDYFRNSVPIAGEPSGWVCTVGGTPGTWLTDGIIGDTAGA